VSLKGRRGQDVLEIVFGRMRRFEAWEGEWRIKTTIKRECKDCEFS